MKTHAVIGIVGKQYLVEKDDELLVQHISSEAGTVLEVPVLMSFDTDGNAVDLAPKEKARISIVEHLKGEKLRVSKFKSKVRYRKTTGFRPQLTKVKVISI